MRRRPKFHTLNDDNKKPKNNNFLTSVKSANSTMLASRSIVATKSKKDNETSTLNGTPQKSSPSVMNLVDTNVLPSTKTAFKV